MTQQNLALNPTAPPGRQEKENAIERVHANNSQWVDHAVAAIRKVAERLDTLTSDDIWTEMGGHIPREPRAMGAAMKMANRLGYIRSTMMTAESRRRQNHRRPVRVWVSRIRRHSE